MTVVASRLEALVIGRASTSGKSSSPAELVKPLARFAPLALAPAAWLARLIEVADGLHATGVLDDTLAVRDPGELTRRLGPSLAQTWPQLPQWDGLVDVSTHCPPQAI